LVVIPQAKSRKRACEQPKPSVRLLSRYLKQKSGKVRAVSLKEVERHLGKHAKPLHPRPITAIDRRTVASLISALAEKNGPTAAKCVRASLASYFTWLTREGLLDANPVAFTNVPTTNAVRSRLLSDDELREIWGALGNDNYGDIVRLLTFTGARRLEIGNLSWDEVDLNAAEIRLPATRCKNNRPHIIPLSAPALAILAQRARNGRAYVFGRGQVGFQGWSRGKRSLDARVPEIPGWVLHDLRRLVSTTMHDKLGFPPHIVEAVLAHVGHKSGIAGTYNKALYLDERRRALERWAERVLAIVVEGRESNVVTLRGA
jgi:integrase